MARATTYLMDPTITLDWTDATTASAIDISDQVSAVTITQGATVLPKTTFGNTWHRKGRGLKTGTIQIDFYVDFDADGMFEVFKDFWENHEYVNFSVSEAGGAAVTGTFVMSQMPSFAGGTDEYNVASLTFDLDGPVTNTART